MTIHRFIRYLSAYFYFSIYVFLFFTHIAFDATIIAKSFYPVSCV